MKEIAIIGSGISGLGAAYYLSRDFRVTIFEKEDYIGGHTNTVEVERNGKVYPVDTGFIVFNYVTYPNLIRLFQELEVEAVPSSMSFSLWNQKDNLYFSFRNLNTLFAQRKNIWSPRFWKLIKEILRFNSIAHSLSLESVSYSYTLEDLLKDYRFDEVFIENFILPMSSAIWSTEYNKILDFPARTLLQFFNNHGLSSVNGQHQWYTVKNGSYNYVKKILARDNITYHTKDPAVYVERRHELNKVFVKTKYHEGMYDYVILATHAPTTLNLLRDATAEERTILGSFRYQENLAILHTDESVMCPDRKIWSSWNYKIGTGRKTSTVYFMQNLQPWLPFPVFVSINEFQNIEESKIIKTITYEHPVFDEKAIRNQENLQKLNNDGPVYFCGAYFRYGFHEDGLISALEVVKKIQEKENVRTQQYEEKVSF